MTTRKTLHRRASGILLHPTSLAGNHYNGDLGPAAYRFADFLASAGQAWWQTLPLGPTGAANSPYQSFSTFAGNPLLISPELLAQSGLLPETDIQVPRPQAPGRVDYGAATRHRSRLLKQAFLTFEKQKRSEPYGRFEGYCEAHGSWLTDFALYCALKQAHGGKSWVDWDPDIRSRRQPALERALRLFGQEGRYYQFLQFQFHQQWSALKDHCARLGIGLIGDLPIFVAHDSADVWLQPDLFWLDPNGRPTVVAGVPPDYFSRTGQRWGNPLYRWDVLRRRGYDWWIARLRATFERFDAVRLDHFIGFHRYWEIPADAATAEKGRWVKGPGAHFFSQILQVLGPVEIVAEDLGQVTPEVFALRDRFAFPGMKVLQFAFGEDIEARPFNHVPRSVVYTGTHDNDTTVGWFKDPQLKRDKSAQRERALALRYMNSDGREVHWDMIRLAWMSPAHTAIIPVQDLLGLGSDARMNLPGREAGDWEWQLEEGALTPSLAERLRLLTQTYGRLPVVSTGDSAEGQRGAPASTGSAPA